MSPDMIEPIEFDQAPTPREEKTAFTTQSETERVKSLIEQAKMAKQGYAEKWRMYEKWYGGTQWPEGRPKYRVSHVINVLFSTVETVQPLLTDDMPVITVQPREPEQFEAAEKLTYAFDFLNEKLDLDMEYSKVIADALKFGTGIIKVFWDRDAPPIVEQETPYGPMSAPLGEVGVTRISPFYIYPDPGAATIDDCAYIVEGTPVDLDLIKLNYPEKADELSSEDLAIAGQSYYYEDSHGRVVNTTRDEANKYPYSDAGKVRNKAMVYEVWVKNVGLLLEDNATVEELQKLTEEFPNGRVITVCGNTILADRQFPFTDGKYPYVKFDDYLNCDNFWSYGEIEMIMPQQKEINKRSSQLIENAQLTANPPLVIDANSGVDTELITSRPGLIIEKNPGTEISYLNPPSIPEYVFAAQKESMFHLETVSGVHDVTQGRKPQGVTAASAIAELQEAAQTRIRKKVRNRNQSIVLVGKLIISRMAQYYRIPRQIRILGGEPSGYGSGPTGVGMGAPQEMGLPQEMGMGVPGLGTDRGVPGTGQGAQPQFTFETLQRDELGGMWDLKVEVGTKLPMSQAGRFQQAITLFELGLVDKEAVLDTVSFPNRGKMIARMEAKEQEQMQMQQQQQQAQMQQQQGFEAEQQGQQLGLQEQQMMMQDAQKQGQMGLEQQKMMMQQAQAEMQAQAGTEGNRPISDRYGGEGAYSQPPLEGMPAPPEGMAPEEAEELMAMMQQAAQGGGQLPPEILERMGGR